MICLAQAQDEVPVAEPMTDPVVESYEYTEAYEQNRKKQTTYILERSDLLDDTLQKKSLPEGFQQKYTDEEFDYSLTKPRESLWTKIQRKIAEIISRFFRSADADAVNNFSIWILRILAVVIVGVVIYLLIRYVMTKDSFGFFAKKDKVINPQDRTIQENIHEIDFKELIMSYEQKQEYRLAVRYQYLHLLKILNDKNLLEWDPEKTNLDYVQELEDSELRQKFSRLTHIFDYVWYGEFTVDSESYEKIKAQFISLKQSV